MPQGRILLKAISESRKLSALSCDGARLLYTWLIPHVDVNGCFSGDPEVVRGQVFTRLKKSVQVVEKYLAELESAGLVVRYTANGDVYLCIPDFTAKQPSLQPHKEGKARIPTPTPEQLQSNSGLTPTQVKESKVKGSKGKGTSGGVTQEQKTQFAECVFLTETEHTRLVEKLGKQKTEDYIERLNDGIQSKGYKYKSHYHTILNWVRMDAEKKRSPSHKETPDEQWDRLKREGMI